MKIDNEYEKNFSFPEDIGMSRMIFATFPKLLVLICLPFLWFNKPLRDRCIDNGYPTKAGEMMFLGYAQAIWQVTAIILLFHYMGW